MTRARIRCGLHRTIRLFGRRQDGAVLVEFALVMPFMLLAFALSVEAGRMLWSYQSTISGVREASRYVARSIPGDICTSGGTLGVSLPGQLKSMVQANMKVDALFPSAVTVNSVTPGFSCVSGAYRGGGPVAVATVSANVTISFPLRGILGMFGNGLNGLTTVVSDQSRIVGQ